MESVKSLQENPKKESAYYGQQSTALLAQISQQLAVNSTHAPLLDQLTPFPTFEPSSSDVRVNAYWFMSPIFSLSAALTVTMVQQWLRSYKQTYRRYDHALKRARLRQLLFDDPQRGRISRVVDAVPSMIHISLFLFFLGLADFLFNMNITVAIAAVIPMAICVSLYFWSILAPVINPQLPYQTPLSGLLWVIVQKLGARKYSENGSAVPGTSVGGEITMEGRAQLAMSSKLVQFLPGASVGRAASSLEPERFPAEIEYSSLVAQLVSPVSVSRKTCSIETEFRDGTEYTVPTPGNSWPFSST